MFNKKLHEVWELNEMFMTQNVKNNDLELSNIDRNVLFFSTFIENSKKKKNLVDEKINYICKKEQL